MCAATHAERQDTVDEEIFANAKASGYGEGREQKAEDDLTWRWDADEQRELDCRLGWLAPRMACSQARGSDHGASLEYWRVGEGAMRCDERPGQVIMAATSASATHKSILPFSLRGIPALRHRLSFVSIYSRSSSLLHSLRLTIT